MLKYGITGIFIAQLVFWGKDVLADACAVRAVLWCARNNPRGSGRVGYWAASV